jgi:1-acyl-sn-glycerol-3-phosphate acyltransferase
MTALRSGLFALAFYLWSAAVAIAMLPLLLAPRRWTVRAQGVWGRGLIHLLRWICAIRVEIRGRQHLPTGPALIAAKHQCMFDTMGLWAELPDPCYVMKKELVKVPFFGWYGLKGGNLVVDREGHSAALRKLVRDTQARMRDDRQVIIFPEGTRAPPGTTAGYKPGVAALYRELALPCTPLATNSGVHWPAHGFMRKPGTIVYEFLEPIPAGLKRAEFMRELEDRIEAASTQLLSE